MWEQAVSGDRLLCTLCPRACRLQEGQRGFCFVRQRRGDEIVLTTYGRSSGFCMDPIEKKPLNHFLPGSAVLSFGTVGCNLACRFCQNWSTSTSHHLDSHQRRVEPAEIAILAQAQGADSVAYTYNDPVIFHEYAVDTAAACHELGIHNVAVTAGYITQKARTAFFHAMDGVNVDLKAFSESFYRKQCAAHLQPVLDTILYLRHETDIWLEITTLLIPGLNDSEGELRELTSWLAREVGFDIPLHFSAFHPDHRLLDRPPTMVATLKKARRIAQAAGLQYVYLGNVASSEVQETLCHGCGKSLIRRRGYQILEYTLENGKCTVCGTVLPGVFGAGSGNWGNRVAPVAR